MEYTIKKLAQIAGISTRTLRYYDDIGLLKPCRTNSSGYRIYGEGEVDLLQQILLYRSMEMSLDEIQQIISRSDFDITKSLQEHRKRLTVRRNQLDQLILTVDKTIAYNKGEVTMSNKEKFEGFKKERLEENETKYGAEIREKYGEDTVTQSNQKFLNLSEAEFKKMQEIELELLADLKEVAKTKDIHSDIAKNVYKKHREWLGFTWPSYSPEAHVGLGQMYVADERFAAYYNEKAGEEVVTVLRDIIVTFAS